MNRGHCHCGHNTVDKVYPIGGYVKIGYSPEGRARRFKFDIAKYCAMWPEARPCMLIQRPGDASSYIANTDMDGGYIVEEGTPQEVILNPKEPRTIDFFNKVL